MIFSTILPKTKRIDIIYLLLPIQLPAFKNNFQLDESVRFAYFKALKTFKLLPDFSAKRSNDPHTHRQTVFFLFKTDQNCKIISTSMESFKRFKRIGYTGNIRSKVVNFQANGLNWLETKLNFPYQNKRNEAAEWFCIRNKLIWLFERKAACYSRHARRDNISNLIFWMIWTVGKTDFLRACAGRLQSNQYCFSGLYFPFSYVLFAVHREKPLKSVSFTSTTSAANTFPLKIGSNRRKILLMKKPSPTISPSGL